jgi:integrase/recombinase XerC
MSDLFDRNWFSDDFAGFRDKTILEFFYNTGVRLSELINLKFNDVDLDKAQAKVLGKRNKERIVPLSPSFANVLREYLQQRLSQNFESDSGYFFCNDSGEKANEKWVYRIVNRYLSFVTTLDKKSPHVLRHTFATHMLNNGAELSDIKEILGHTSLAATQVYTHNRFEKLKKVYKQAHPRA